MLRLCKAEFIKYAHEIRCYYPDQLVSIIVTVIMFALFLLLNGNQTESAFIGFVYWYLLSSVISEAAVSISAEKQMGILDQLIIKPFPFEWLILARTFSWLIVNLLKVVVVSCILSVLLRVPLSFNGQYLGIFLITVVGVFGFTLLLVGLTLKYTKTASFDSIISYALLFFTGAILPAEQMPAWATFLGAGLPITKGIEMTRSLALGGAVTGFDYGVLAVQSLFFFAVGYGIFYAVYASGKKSGLDRRY